MDGFYQVTHSDGSHIMYAAVLSRTEIEDLHARGFAVILHPFEKNPSKVWPINRDAD